MAEPRGEQTSLRRNWTARVRASAMDAARYSRFVARMKGVLSISAFAVIFAVIAFFFVQRLPRQASLSYGRLGQVENDLTMLKPHLSGVDAKGNPFVITADRAVQDPHNAKRATLEKVDADLSMGSKGWINARALHGAIDMAASRLELRGGIEMFSDSGYELRTNSASVDLKANAIQGHETVNGQGPLGTMRADSFHGDRESNQMVLTGHVFTTIYGHGK